MSGPWSFSSETRQLEHSKLGRCLSIHPDSKQLVLQQCDRSNLYHQWQWGEITPHWARH